MSITIGYTAIKTCMSKLCIFNKTILNKTLIPFEQLCLCDISIVLHCVEHQHDVTMYDCLHTP